MSFTVALLNHTLSYYSGDIGIASFGVIFRLLSLILMPIMGLSMGLQPIVGFNYGAHQFSRVRQSIKMAIIVSTIVATTGFLVVLLFPEAIMRIFTKDLMLVSSGSNALRLCMLSLPVVGCQVVGTAFFQALGKAVPALMLTLSRQVLALIPLLIFLPRVWGLNGVWISFPVADIVAFIITMAFVWAELKKMPKTAPAISM
jgi:Na+-driven multidrug efflux pump